jgi:GT2 family glycosyltransferase
MKISILMASYGPQSQKYLDLCFRSLEAQTFKDFEVIHVSSGDFEPKSWKPAASLERGVFAHSKERLHFPAAIAKAYELSDKSSETILLLNDDVIMQKDCLKKLYDVATKMPCLVNPRSNCDDNGRYYISTSPFTKLQYRSDEMESLFNQVIEYEDYYPFTLIRQPMAHFYATMMTRKIWDDVGGIDVNLRTGFDDQDFSHRANQKGYFSCIAMHAYALHGSGATADPHLSQEDRKFNEDYYREKWK